MDACLYRAVVEVDVAGYVACTTEADRRTIRRDLGIEVQLDVSAYGTARVGGGPVDHAEVIAARKAHPEDTCRQLAERLSCSTSTIKRHLRQEREGRGRSAVATLTKPSVADVLDRFDRLESSSRI